MYGANKYIFNLKKTNLFKCCDLTKRDNNVVCLRVPFLGRYYMSFINNNN